MVLESLSNDEGLEADARIMPSLCFDMNEIPCLIDALKAEGEMMSSLDSKLSECRRGKASPDFRLQVKQTANSQSIYIAERTVGLIACLSFFHIISRTAAYTLMLDAQQISSAIDALEADGGIKAPVTTPQIQGTSTCPHVCHVHVTSVACTRDICVMYT